MSLKFSGTAKDGKFLPDDPDRVKSCLKNFDEKTIDVTIRLYKTTRSNEQNRYYWGVVIKLLCEHTGFAKDEMHEVLKQKFLLRTIIIEKNGKVHELEFVKSTTKINTSYFEEYLSKCRDFSLIELDVYIPLPHECPSNYHFNL